LSKGHEQTSTNGANDRRKKICFVVLADKTGIGMIQENHKETITPEEHFKLYFYAAVTRIIEQAALSFEATETAFEQFPFLIGYRNELAVFGIDLFVADNTNRWQQLLRDAESQTSNHLPLRSLKDAACLDHSAITLFMATGVMEEDARFGLLFEAMQCAAQRRPTAGLLADWWRADETGEARANLRRLIELGLVQTVNPEAPRIEWALQPNGMLWDILRGERIERLAPWALYKDAERCAPLEDVTLNEAIRPQALALPRLLESGDAQAFVIRGPQHNGRRTLAGAIARALNLGVIEITNLSSAETERWRMIGAMAALLNAMPVAVFDPAPGETIDVPALNGYAGPLAIVTGKQGGVAGEAVRSAITLALDMPEADGRNRLWSQAIEGREVCNPDCISERFRITSGNIHRAARLASSYSALENRTSITLADVQQATRAMGQAALDTLAERLETTGDWSLLATAAQTFSELLNLELLCRHRERLRESLSPAFGSHMTAGVRALFSGVSGTGKTLAARLLASVLQKDIYRLDLSSVVSKYIGETEKNLSRVFARAEELDVILLIDEGDALMASRTEVRNSTDRYANLETNYLLQRLESFEGILLVTTNAGDRIDSAFRRRMDVVVDFRLPDGVERWAIWQLHLPSSHLVDQSMLREVAARCQMTGGQIRNAALHAALLALEDGIEITNRHLESAVQREYRKAGAICPLRQASTLSVARK